MHFNIQHHLQKNYQKYCERAGGRIEAILFKMSEPKSSQKSVQKQFRKYCRFRYGEEVLAKALQDIENGSENLSSASKKYDIPKSTLHNKLNKKTPNIRKMGPQPVLNELEEQRLEHWILAKAKLGFPMHPSEIKDAVQKILTETRRPNPFNNNRPGEKWLKLFLQRHPNIAKRNTEIISKSRAAVTETAIRQWFHDLKEYLRKHDLLDMMENPSRIFNADETGVRTCVKSGLVLGPVSKNFKNLYEISSGNEKESITVLCTYNASGIAAPPMVIFPYKRIPKELALSVPGSWGTGRSDSGWMTGATFFEYVANVFYNWLVAKEITFPVILFIDGHKSHYSIELYEFCIDKNIILYCLYPNSTHILQPCDVTIFKPLKVEWKKACQSHKQRTSAAITRYNFCPLFAEAFAKASQPSTVMKGFEICGLYPLNPDKVDFSKCISTRRNELFPKTEIVGNDLTSQDYESCLKVMNHFFGPAKLEEYEKVEEKSRSEDNTYALWKFCTDFTDANEISSTKNESKSNFDNTSIAEQEPPCEALTETFLNDLPFEIDGVIYAALDNKDNSRNEYETLDELDVNQIVFPNCESNNKNDDLVEPADSVKETNELTEIVDALSEIPEPIELAESQSSEEYKWMSGVTESILDRVFEITEKEQRSHPSVTFREDTTQGVIEYTKREQINNKIEIISNVVVRDRTEDDGIWKKHLHWPHQDEKSRKNARKNATKMPFAITSLQWLEYYEQQDKAKKEKEEAIRIRKLKREQRASSQAEKIKTLKRKREKTHEDKETKAKRDRNEKENGCSSSKIDRTEVKRTPRKNSRKKIKNSTKNMIEVEEDNISSSGSEFYVTTVEEKFEKITRSKSKKETTYTDIAETPKQILGVGDYVIVNYDNKLYPGIIKTVQQEQFEISVMEKTSNGKWKWPTVTDQIWYTRNQIVKKIAEPQTMNSRGIYNIEM